jgi:cation-transporting ATPase E
VTSTFRTPDSGLTDAEVTERIAAGRVNDAGTRTSRTFGEIVRANVFTRFNAILGTMLVIILIVGPIQDALFGGILIANTMIGIVQEYRAKRTLDRLAVLSAPRAHAIRDGNPVELAVEEVVLDDLLVISAGDQVPADGEVRTVDGLEVDESLLTGESDPIAKQPGDALLSGSIVVAGSGRFHATAVGTDAYAHKLAVEARRFTLVRSEIVAGINRILKYATWAMGPTAILLLVSQLRSHDGLRAAASGVVAGVVAMIPEGLVLLTSISFGVAALTLARRSVLVQELPAVESLARVDVVCLDKTGTITEGSIVFHAVEPLDDGDDGGSGGDGEDVEAALAALAADEHPNATMLALRDAFPEPGAWRRSAAVAFSSKRKWSGATFDGGGTWVIGAPEMVLAGGGDDARARADEVARTGRRVLLLARSEQPLEADELPHGLVPRALVVFEEQVRSDAAETLAYFREQGVELRLVSGDNPRTVGAVAARVGFEGADEPVDARELPDDPDELAEIMATRTVFGRVSPHQKQAMVRALQQRGSVVAMTGDGVNDALALKDADIGIAMGSGAPATRAVAQLVLLDGRFARMPGVVAEGRRVIANVERVANLFVTKTIYAMLLAMAVGVAGWPYPFLPRHLTIISSLTIGIPGFFLALAPNARRYNPGFVERVLRFAVPAGFVAAAATFFAYWGAREAAVTVDEARTTATLTLLAIGLGILGILARPLSPTRTALVGAMAAMFLAALVVPAVRDFYALDVPSLPVLVEALAITAAALAVLEMGWILAQRRVPQDRRTPRIVRRTPRPSAPEAAAARPGGRR